MSFLEKFDSYFVDIINNKLKSNFLDKFMYTITDIGGAIGTTIMAIVIFIIGRTLKNGYENIGLELLVVLAISQTIVQILKRTIKRKRPYDSIVNLNTFDIKLPDYSFPSGHTTASFALASVISLNNGLWIIPSYIYAIIIGISRIYLGVHYPSDVLFGIVLAILSAYIVHYYIFENLLLYLNNLI